MDKAIQIGRDSATGTLKLFLGRTISTVILAVGSMVLARLILPADYGLYSISLVPATLFGLFQDWGISSALTKCVANYRAAGKDSEIHDMVTAVLTFEIATGVVLSLVCLFSASYIATAVYHRPEATPLISVASVTILSGTLLTTSQSAFVGFERMEYSSLTMMCQAIVQSLVAPLLVFIGFGALGATLGYLLGAVVAGTIGVIVLFAIILKKRAQPRIRTKRLETLKFMLRYGVPLHIAAILGGFVLQFYGLMMGFFISDNVILGNYRVASNFAVLVTFITIPVSTALFPAFAKIDPQNEQKLLRNVFSSSAKYTSLFLVPATMAVIVLSKPMINTLFGDKWTEAPFLLVLSVLVNLLVVFGSLSMGSFLPGVGETRMVLKLNLLTLCVGIPLALVLIPTLGITGVILGSSLTGVPSTFWGLHWVWKNYQAKANFRSSARIIAASGFAAGATYMSVNLVSVADWIKLVIGGSVFLAGYVLAAPLMKAVIRTDIENLRMMTSGLGILSRLINIPLTIAERIAKSVFGSKNNSKL